MTERIIEVQKLCKSFDGKTVVNAIDLSVNQGEVFGFLGPNGSGKTTTIRMLCGLLTPDSGEGHCLGFDILTQSRAIKKQVGYMTQHFSFYTDLTVTENLRFFAMIYGLNNRDARVAQCLKDMGLWEYQDTLAAALSGGWKQRMALAACLLHEPKLLLLDEPTAGVDPVARREFWDKIHALSERGITVFVSTHYMDEAERCTRLAYLAHGRLLVTGTVSDVIATTHLSTWLVMGEVTSALLRRAKACEGVIQAALFGNRLHIAGYDNALIEKALMELSQHAAITWQPVEASLEDAYISLVNATGSDHE